MAKSVFLIGARGAGKSYVGTALATRLGYRFLDTDEQICRQAGCSVRDIVSRHGWQGFRRLETLALQQSSALENVVVATGGGAVLHEELWREIRRSALVIWLTAPVEILIRRVAADAKSAELRPSLTDADSQTEFYRILAERTPLYQRAAHHIIDTGSLDRTQVVADIVRVIGSTLSGGTF